MGCPARPQGRTSGGCMAGRLMASKDKTKTCMRCGGNGKEPDVSERGRKALFQKWVKCPKCGGSGRVRKFWS